MNVKNFKKMTNEEIEDFITNNDHNEEYDEEHDLVHIYWDCEKCEAESEKEYRYQVLISKDSGNLPFMERSISKIIFAGDVKVGDYTKYLSRPGVSNYPYEYAECVALWYDSNLTGKVTIEWKKTNTSDKPFAVMYDTLDNVNIIRSL